MSRNSYSDSKIKFKHLVDYYLTSGQDFGDILRTIDADKILVALLSNSSENDGDNQKRNKEKIVEEAEEQDGFNEKLIKTMCLN